MSSTSKQPPVNLYHQHNASPLFDKHGGVPADRRIDLAARDRLTVCANMHALTVNGIGNLFGSQSTVCLGKDDNDALFNSHLTVGINKRKGRPKKTALLPIIRRLVLNQVLTSHIGRLFQAHDVEDRRSHVGKDTIGNLSRLVLIVTYIDERNRVQRVGSIRSAIRVNCVIGITVVSNEADNL